MPRTFGMEVAERFEDLVTWQVLRELEIDIHRLAERDAIKRDFKFRDQIIDAAGSAVRNVAEGFGRYNPTENARFLDVTRASTLEVQACLQTARSRGLISQDEFEHAHRLTERGLQLTAGLQRYLRSPAAQRNAARFRYRKARERQ